MLYFWLAYAAWVAGGGLLLTWLIYRDKSPEDERYTPYALVVVTLALILLPMLVISALAG